MDRTPPREVFTELLDAAMAEQGAHPSPLAVGYLIELLEERVRAPARARVGQPAEPETLAEALLEAHQEKGAPRAAKLRALGDRSLFIAGFFGESLSRSLVGVDYYGQIGSTAYGQLSRFLSARAAEPWPELFRELADEFGVLVDLLADVSAQVRPGQPIDLLRLFDRYVATGSARDRARLARHGLVPPPRDLLRRWQ